MSTQGVPLGQYHGAIIISINGVILQGLGFKQPPGYYVGIPKYILDLNCRESPWRRRRLCLKRLLKEYGPRGLEAAYLKSKPLLDNVYLEQFNVNVPAIKKSSVLSIVNPPDALIKVVTHADMLRNFYSLYGVLSELEAWGVDLHNLGLTGSLAMGFANPQISDIDLVVYGAKGALAAYDYFIEKSRVCRRGTSGKNAAAMFKRSQFGGLRVEPPIEVSWRRLLCSKSPNTVSWVGVPETPLSHCGPLERMHIHDLKPARLKLRVEGGHESSLLYPPCTISYEGIAILSFEYNVGGILYRGGKFLVEGLYSPEYNVVLLASRERPGFIRIL